MDTIRDGLAAGALFVSVVVWLVRLEGRATINSRDLLRLEQRLKDQRKEDIKNRAVEHSEVMSQIAEMRKDMREDFGALRADMQKAMSK